VHDGRLLVVITEDTRSTQCTKTERYTRVCFEDVREALGDFMHEAFWPSFREAEIGTPEDQRPNDYVLEVSLALEALPPGWSAGAKARYKLTHSGQTLISETLAARSRADLPYGAPLASGAADTLAAISYHIGTRVCQTPTEEQIPSPNLPEVASQKVN
jgi:hypothetical protein